MMGSSSLLCFAPTIMLEQCMSMVLSSKRAWTFLDGIEFAREVGELLHEELVHLHPVLAVAVREQVMNHVVDAVPGLLHAGQIRETQGAVVVVELQRGDARGVGLKTEHEDVAS